MLKIYTDMKYIPSGVKFVNDPEPLFGVLGIPDTEDVRTVLRMVENAQYCSDRMFTDRFGGNLYLTCLSTGSKALLGSIALGDSYVVDASELGYLSADVLAYLHSGSIYYPRVISLYNDEDIEYMVNGDICVGSEELTLAIGGVRPQGDDE